MLPAFWDDRFPLFEAGDILVSLRNINTIAVIDPATGIVLSKKPGDRVSRGEPILALHYNDDRGLREAVRLAESAIGLGTAPAGPTRLIQAWVHEHGETSYI